MIRIFYHSSIVVSKDDSASYLTGGGIHGAMTCDSWLDSYMGYRHQHLRENEWEDVLAQGFDVNDLGINSSLSYLP